ncbi:hypothetical protein HMPREF0786_00229 [Staphylococcus capitis C87]|nr:hypothetical protein HMPREF0786_00229 [Staphylococcus capitis C87]GGI35234.1 hypothetical protein GCM10008141_06590 [Staphylococcus capitis]
MSELKVRLYQASFNPSHPCRGGTTKIIITNYISVPLFILYNKLKNPVTLVRLLDRNK